MEKSRIFSEIHEIDYGSTKRFWDHRATLAGQVNELSVTMFQDDAPELVAARDEHEKQVVAPLLRTTSTTKVLDIGCGTGRWGNELDNQVDSYVGVDFSEGLVEIGNANFEKSKLSEGFGLLQGSATDLLVPTVEMRGPFDLFILSGICIYLNDADVAECFRQVALLSAPEAQIYLREPVATDERLTLNSHFSTDMQHEYSAVYRNRQFYDDLLHTFFVDSGFVVDRSEPLYPAALSNRKETSQFYWLLSRGNA